MARKRTPRHSQNLLLNRTPIQNSHTSRYLLLTLLSFAFSVSATRLFLNITGFPQLGGGNLHIAHVLWGGLLLFIAGLLPLILANNWALNLSAIISGLGIGLFIDEVGKFITANNDYFYASAAPIIYAFFLLTVLVFVQLRSRHKPSPRSTMYSVLTDLKEVLDQDLSQDEKDALLTRLNPIAEQKEEIELSRLAKVLIDFLSSSDTRIVPKIPTLLDRIQAGWITFEAKRLTRKNLKAIIVVMLLLWSVWAIFYPVGFILSSRTPAQLQAFIQSWLSDRLIRNASGFNWVEARVFIEGATGVVAIVAAVFLLAKKEKFGLTLAYLDMLVVLTVVNLVVFYFDQFSTILFAIPQFILLILIIRYRDRFVRLVL